MKILICFYVALVILLLISVLALMSNVAHIVSIKEQSVYI